MKGNPIYRLVSLVIMVSVVLAHTSGQIDMTQPNWIWVPVFVAVMMLQATFTGFCPAAKFFGKDPETGDCCGADTTGSCCSPKEAEASTQSTETTGTCCGDASSSDKTDASDGEVIKVLGTGCANCETTAKLIQQQADNLGVTIVIEKVTEMPDIAGYGVMSTPAVVIKEKVVHSGGVPSVSQVKAWLAAL